MDRAMWVAVGVLATWVYMQHNYVCVENLNHLLKWLYK
jgi:hypothetical protein